MSNEFRSQWGPDHSPEFGLWMLAIVAFCMSGFLASIFPIIEVAISFFVITVGIFCAIRIALKVRNERRLDHEAMYGPITEQEKEQSNG